MENIFNIVWAWLEISLTLVTLLHSKWATEFLSFLKTSKNVLNYVGQFLNFIVPKQTYLFAIFPKHFTKTKFLSVFLQMKYWVQFLERSHVIEQHKNSRLTVAQAETCFETWHRMWSISIMKKVYNQL